MSRDAGRLYKEILEKLASGEDLSLYEAYKVGIGLLTSPPPEAVVGAILFGLRVKGERPDEIAGFARALRETCIRVAFGKPLLDTAGTGGDGSHTLNVSTAASIVASAAGAYVAKHGNRAITSASGSADVLEALGYNVSHGPEEARCMLEKARFTFLFAPRYHGSMRNVMPVRRALGVRTVFNLVGPLSNPAGASRQTIGVATAKLAPLIAEAASHLGYEKAVVVHGSPGIDEFSVFGDTLVYEVGRGTESYHVSPEDLGLRKHRLSDVRVSSVEESAARIVRVLEGRGRPADRDFILANAAAALYAYGMARDLKDGVEISLQAIEGGAARRHLDNIIEANKLCTGEASA
ncbi:anthranilate phosphoribosyltransferase [Aeropyrum camini]|uniref:Anthranilate phosphoribosyltransferase n=1 Tax=Aeropyrum camini SY1 = JCM 12091 TaxID=1198449 RepID=U3TAQ1_9CREN|nr:anthranilate phosphoribosyltransferase [Aeropyrum camini]BAN89501.1 anthranilate phosphoribosyltransferase [Aeropyrum camini SY1 = JCM 12091]